LGRPQDTGFFASRDDLVRAIWDLHFEGLSQGQIRERCGVSQRVYTQARAEAVVSFEPTREQMIRLQSALKGA
jgi:DNA-binding transcriptional regulator LsrR (DeoR family)